MLRRQVQSLVVMGSWSEGSPRAPVSSDFTLSVEWRKIPLKTQPHASRVLDFLVIKYRVVYRCTERNNRFTVFSTLPLFLAGLDL